MIRRRLAGLVVVFFLLGAGCATSPLGRSQLILVSPQEMSAMGLQAFAQLKSERPLSSNATQRRYVQCVADAITNVLTREDMGVVVVRDWETELFDDPTANAFALPGGRMGVHTGLLDVATSQHQLAAVMGHEVGHVLGRHGAERVSSQQAGALVMASAQEWAGASPEDRSRAMIAMGVGVGVQLGQLKYGRTHESEADEIGVMLMARAGFDPRESVTLWQNMGRASGGQAPPEFLSTHPSGTTRIARLERAMPSAMAEYERARAAGRRPSCR